MLEKDSLGLIIGRQLDKERLQKEKETLLSVLREKSVTAVFQPVVDLAAAQVYGYEVIIRGPADGPLHSPEKLFAAAYRFSLADQLEELCREIASRAAEKNDITKKIFVSIDPTALMVQQIAKYIHPSLLPELGRNLQNIIVEINQRHFLDSAGCILECGLNFFRQGFPPLDIDRTEKGFSSLQPISNLRPEYIKIDRALVHNVSANLYHAKLITSMAEYAHSIGAKVIAQGVESDSDLTTVAQLGIDYVQGHFLATPSPVPPVLSPEIIRLIRECRNQNNIRKPATDAVLGMSIGEIVEYCPTMESGTLVSQAEVVLTTEKAGGVVVLSNRKPIGLLMKNRLYFQLGTRYGVSLYHNRSVDKVMDAHPLVVDASLPLDSVSHLAMARADDNKYDFIIVTNKDEYAGIVSITNLLNNMTNLQVRCATNANPLTGLPGNLLIDQKLKSLVEKGSLFAVLYLDLDNFKAFNDKYGFEHGDKALLLSAEVMKSCIKRVCRQEAFLGHIGGDDFVIITEPSEIEPLCQAIVREFDREIISLYETEDLARGAIYVRNRRGRMERYPIISISIGVVHNKCRSFSNYLEISGVAAVLKKAAKDKKGSTYVVDQRKAE